MCVRVLGCLVILSVCPSLRIIKGRCMLPLKFRTFRFWDFIFFWISFFLFVWFSLPSCSSFWSLALFHCLACSSWTATTSSSFSSLIKFLTQVIKFRLWFSYVNRIKEDSFFFLSLFVVSKLHPPFFFHPPSGVFVTRASPLSPLFFFSSLFVCRISFSLSLSPSVFVYSLSYIFLPFWVLSVMTSFFFFLHILRYLSFITCFSCWIFLFRGVSPSHHMQKRK